MAIVMVLDDAPDRSCLLLSLLDARQRVSIGDPRGESGGRFAEELRPRPERKGWSKFKHGTSVPYSATRGLFQIEHLSMR